MNEHFSHFYKDQAMSETNTTIKNTAVSVDEIGRDFVDILIEQRGSDHEQVYKELVQNLSSVFEGRVKADKGAGWAGPHTIRINMSPNTTNPITNKSLAPLPDSPLRAINSIIQNTKKALESASPEL